MYSEGEPEQFCMSMFILLQLFMQLFYILQVTLILLLYSTEGSHEANFRVHLINAVQSTLD